MLGFGTTLTPQAVAGGAGSSGASLILHAVKMSMPLTAGYELLDGFVSENDINNGLNEDGDAYVISGDGDYILSLYAGGIKFLNPYMAHEIRINGDIISNNKEGAESGINFWKSELYVIVRLSDGDVVSVRARCSAVTAIQTSLTIHKIG